METTRPPAERPQTTLKLGGLTLRGPWATLALLILLGLVAAVVVWSRPSVKMLLSAALWIAFVVYWSAAARGAAPARSSESARSRALHQNLMNGALLLLFLPVPGLRTRLLPDAAFLVPLGLAIQAAFGLRKIRLEETSLRQVFGTSYEAYPRESWALVPWVL